MTDAINEAAAAFQRDLSGTDVSSGGGAAETTKKAEPIFDNFNVDEGGEGGFGEEDYVSDEPVKPTRKPKPEPDGDDVDADTDEDDVDDEADADDDEADADDEPDEFLDQEVEVVVDGEPTKVKMKEALEGYVRTETFHRRLNKLAEAKQLIHTEAVKVIEDRKRYTDRLSEADKLLTEIIPEEPDWDVLFKEDPTKARNLQKQYTSLQDKIGEIRAAKKKADDEAAVEELDNLRAYAETEKQKLFSAVPDWSDQKTMAKDLDSMRRTASAAGFTPEEYGQMYDHRMFVILRKAAKYDRMTANKPKPVQKGGKPVRPGAGSQGTAPKGVARAQSQLRKTGSVEDAANVFKQFL